MRQWHCYVGGQQYGPITEDVLREWARTGRLSPTDNVWTEGMAEWAPASTVEGLFASTAGGSAAGTGAVGAPEAGAPGAAAGLGAGAGAFGTTGRYLKPHRGTTVLVLGILGIFCCVICGIIAWAMAAGDLKEMKAGQMDPAGEGTTRAGMICGIVGVVLAAISTVIWIVSMAASARMQGF